MTAWRRSQIKDVDGQPLRRDRHPKRKDGEEVG